jgi:hypothetical protein
MLVEYRANTNTMDHYDFDLFGLEDVKTDR